jgi:N-acetylglucosamine-6-phosphate deacetylase
MFDLQVNGFKNKDLSCNFWQQPPTYEIKLLNSFLYKEGIFSYLATLITDSYDSIKTNLEILQKTQDEQLVGAHIEGGLISKLGVHPKNFAQEFNLKKIQELVKIFPGLIKLWTFCPSLDKNGDITKFLQDSNIKVSYGHSNCDYETAWNAFENYHVDLVTHWGNAMFVYNGFKQRDTSDEMLKALDSIDPCGAGIGLAAYRHPKVNLMAISGSKAHGDLHLDPNLVKKLFEKKAKKIILVSDLVHYDSPETPNELVGGLTSLKTHSQNAIELGINKELVEHATTTLPRQIFG